MHSDPGPPSQISNHGNDVKAYVNAPSVEEGTLAHNRQVKDNFISLRKLSTQMFSIAVQAKDNVQNFKNRFRKLISRRFWTYL